MVSSASREAQSVLTSLPRLLITLSTQHCRSPLLLSLFSSEVLWPDLSIFLREEEGQVLRPDFASGLGAGSCSRPCFHNPRLVFPSPSRLRALRISCTFRLSRSCGRTCQFFLIKRKDRPCDQTLRTDSIHGDCRGSCLRSLPSLVFSSSSSIRPSILVPLRFKERWLFCFD